MCVSERCMGLCEPVCVCVLLAMCVHACCKFVHVCVCIHVSSGVILASWYLAQLLHKVWQRRVKKRMKIKDQEKSNSGNIVATKKRCILGDN